MNWHARYLQQAAWTRDLRTYLFDQADLTHAQRVLEVGCGTGAILQNLVTTATLHGLDIDPAALALCRLHAPRAVLTHGDGLQLPYPSHIFDIVYCHFYLLWVANPLQAVLEMQRVTKPGGHILALAEPDYSARMDEPVELKVLGEWQATALIRQGANPAFGRQLAETFHQAGITLRETGTIQGGGPEPSVEDWDMEWAVIESDLAGLVPGGQIQKLKELDRQARAKGDRILHVPTHFAWGAAKSVG